MNLYAIGNCHIDTAWLWTYDETKRKCARSWSSTLRLMDCYPKLIFAISQAQQVSLYQNRYCKMGNGVKILNLIRIDP
jgi:alpha-mannosidase